ncbi:Protein CBG11297 [Caenorhabditis briggsae]|uniref:Protein CBG11297 n=1 Tax=Caenorhabditis briggsae TaxID=6238 RepID=A8XDC6_CAEBR|nr:Protein CBG11297 [Caenorhabditis briggsae]CAP30645.2 Protein CBG11297 [Caenorhabditis briggsae]
MILSKTLRTPQLLFRTAKATDKERVIKFLTDHFAKEEPCLRALRLGPETTEAIFNTTVTRCLKYPFSTVVLQENGDLAGCLVASVWNRTDPIGNADFDDSVQFINNAHANFWKIAPPHVNSVIHREMGSVAPEFTRLGIATKMHLKELPYSDIKDSKGNEILKLDDGTTALRLNYKAIEDYGDLPE